MPAKILIYQTLLITRRSSALNDRPKHAILLGGLLNRAMFSHSCPSQVHGLSARPHKEYAQREVIYYSLQYVLGPHEWKVTQSITSKPALAHMLWFPNDVNRRVV